MIELIDLCKSFGEKRVLAGVSLRAETGQRTFIIGTSGSGKSVLVRHLVGLHRADSGRILVDGRDITHLTERQFFEVRQVCGMVFQHATLFDSMSALENVAMPLIKRRRVAKREAAQRAREALALVHCEEFRDALPAELGMGIQKRIAIARCLALEPRYVIYDEPTTGLDPISARRIDALIRHTSEVLGVTALVVSHDLASIFTVANQVAMLHCGRLHFCGTPQELRATPDGVVQQFIHGRPEGPL